jgi:hypothetical protein
VSRSSRERQLRPDAARSDRIHGAGSAISVYWPAMGLDLALSEHRSLWRRSNHERDFGRLGPTSLEGDRICFQFHDDLALGRYNASHPPDRAAISSSYSWQRREPFSGGEAELRALLSVHAIVAFAAAFQRSLIAIDPYQRLGTAIAAAIGMPSAALLKGLRRARQHAEAGLPKTRETLVRQRVRLLGQSARHSS